MKTQTGNPQSSFCLAMLLAVALIAIGTISGGAAEDRPTLKDTFKNDFMIGVAVNQRQFTGQDTNGVALIKAHFNSLSPENVLKWDTVHPRSGTNGYNFEPGDRYVEFGEKNQMYLIGHTLVWHSQTPRWVFQDGTNRASREVLLERMRDHIHTVVGHYKGRIKCWDVVNEAINDNKSATDTNIFRLSPWYTIIGPDFVAKAFQYAHEADPDAILRYNDYSIENEPKRKRLMALIRMLQAEKIPVMAIGSQTHANLTWPDPALEEETLTEIASLGLPIHITELDVNASRRGQQSQSADIAQNNQATGGTNQPPIENAEQLLSQQYSNLFAAFRKHRNVIKVVTFWGVTDADSWRREGTPLLFDGKWQTKPAFDAVIGVGKSAGTTATK